MDRPLTWEDAMLAGIAVVAGVVAAGALHLVLRRLQGRAQRTATTGDDLLLYALRDLASWALVVVGLWIGSAQLPLSRTAEVWWRRILLAALVLLATLVLARVVTGLVRRMLARTGVASSASIFVNIARVVTLAIGVLVLLQTVGLSITPLLTAMGVGGIAIALALQDTLANLFAGVHIIASRKVKPGDYIQLTDGHEGYVVDINWRNTTMQGLLDNMVIVPNALLASGVVINYDQPSKKLLIVVQAGVSYDSDLGQVERVTAEVAREVLSEVDGGDASFEPLVRFHTFGESSIDFSLILQLDEFGDQYVVKHELIKRLHERYGAEGIEIPFPIRTVKLAGTTQAAVNPE